MLEKIEGLPDNVVGIVGKGEVTRDDYRNVLEPAVSAALERHSKVRMLYVLGDEVTGISPGAMWEDGKVGFEHLSRWERMAVVTDKEWIRHTINAFNWLVPGQIRTFTVAQRDEARAWISG